MEYYDIIDNIIIDGNDENDKVGKRYKNRYFLLII